MDSRTRLLTAWNFEEPDRVPLEMYLVRRAIDEGAPGGGFSLRTTGGAVGNGKTREQCIKNIDCNLALIDAWREFGSYC